MNKHLSIKKMKEMVLPQKGDIVKCDSGSYGTVIYVHKGKIRITCIGVAHINEIININSLNFQVVAINGNKWNAEYVGVKNNASSNTAKLI